MIISRFIKSKCVYIHLHAELSYQSTFIRSGLDSNGYSFGGGVFGRLLDIQTMKRVCESLINDSMITPEHSVILD